MKIYIPSYTSGEPILKTYNILTNLGLKPNIVVHNKEQASKYNVPVLISNTAPGLENQRNWIIEQTEKDEWHMQIVQDALKITKVSDEHYNKPSLPVKQNKELRHAYETPVTLKSFNQVMEDTIKEAERVKAKLAGFAIVDNFYFREKKFRYSSFIEGRCILIKKSDLRFDNTVIGGMDDYEFYAANLLRYGIVLRNDYFCAECERYQTGGYGSYEKRLPKKLKAAKYIHDKYPGLFNYQKKANCHPLAELRSRVTNPKQVANWRRSLLSQNFK